MTEFDGVELIQWAERYGHPEEWAKKAQAAWGLAEKRLIEIERLRELLLSICRVLDGPHDPDTAWDRIGGYAHQVTAPMRTGQQP